MRRLSTSASQHKCLTLNQKFWSTRIEEMKRQDRVEAYAVVRMDDFLGPDTPLERKFSVKEILPTLESAKAEVERLNGLQQGDGQRYFWQTTRLVGFFPRPKA